MSDAPRPRRAMSSTQRDMQPRVAARAPSQMERDVTPSSGVPTVSFDDDKTTEIDLLAVDHGTREGLRQERDARRRLRDALKTQATELGNQRKVIDAQSKVIDTLVLASGDAKAAASGARLAKHIRAALVAVLVLVPGTAIGAGKALLSAVKTAEARLTTADAERLSIRHDIDELRREHAALTHLLRGTTP